jgi:uncharacterized protein
VSSPFLTADWHTLAILNYAVDPALLKPLVPAGTALDTFDGRAYISVVGFRFERTRVRGLWIPFHSDFDEVNLRFYVRRIAADELRRGVVFIREIVPRWAIAAVARSVYGERYVSLPMRHRIAGPVSEGGRRQVEYGFRNADGWCHLRVECEGNPTVPPAGGFEQFITEHYWGYTAHPDGRTLEYRVQHDPWRVWRVTNARFEGDPAGLYPAQFGARLQDPPDSAFLAEGSAVAVHPPQLSIPPSPVVSSH